MLETEQKSPPTAAPTNPTIPTITIPAIGYNFNIILKNRKEGYKNNYEHK